MTAKPAHTGPESSVYYHNDNPDDPYIQDDQRHRMLDDTLACWACDCAEHQDHTCRCSCHTNRRHH